MLCLLEALEIFSNPYDLFLSIFQNKNNEKYGIVVSRAKGHNFKLLISSEAVFETSEKAQETIKSILELAKKVSLEKIKEKDGFVSRILNIKDTDIDQTSILFDELIEKIIGEIKINQEVDTSKFDPYK